MCANGSERGAREMMYERTEVRNEGIREKCDRRSNKRGARTRRGGSLRGGIRANLGGSIVDAYEATSTKEEEG